MFISISLIILLMFSLAKIFSKFIESIEVLSVRDAGGNDVFADSQVNRNSNELIFAVPNDYFLLLSEAVFVGGIEIIPVPRNEAYRVDGDASGTKVSKEEIVNFILEKVSELSDEIDIDNILEGQNKENPASNIIPDQSMEN